MESNKVAIIYFPNGKSEGNLWRLYLDPRDRKDLGLLEAIRKKDIVLLREAMNRLVGANATDMLLHDFNEWSIFAVKYLEKATPFTITTHYDCESIDTDILIA